MALVSHGTLVRFKPYPIPLLGSEVNYSSHFPLMNISKGKLIDFLRSLESFTVKISISSGRMESGKKSEVK